MRIFGRIEGCEDLVALSEIAIQVEPGVLKDIAAFFSQCAQEMEVESSWEHEHFSDSEFGNDSFPEIIIARLTGPS
ncbi:hypothetical protein [Methyloversatilis sp.]|uniref:hypothetical protein n=1 Tax=Methyloversatilis sp. TaxID=2569862 RepID=UPI002736CD51|nr:hypothetical protein [Methyloversatilis sp.]MDP3289458.1 hypothetical protein [Methyloversatilis sp.]MDP3453883.1 hypothetical protein [Methyloversatilis sp.]MDP3579833.1 hypothetical protein [Methyloversatilis sp.]